MKHRIGYNRLGRKTAHRKAMTRNMLTSLFKHERIRTTKAKALAVRRTAEKMITRAKLDSVHNRRIIGKDIKDQAILAKIFTDIGPRFKKRPGGYTRVLKLGPRMSDAAEMVILELVADEVEEKKEKKKSAASKTTSKAAKKDSASTEEKKSTKKKVAPVEADASETVSAEQVTEAPNADAPVEETPEKEEGAAAAEDSVEAKQKAR